MKYLYLILILSYYSAVFAEPPPFIYVQTGTNNVHNKGYLFIICLEGILIW